MLHLKHCHCCYCYVRFQQPLAGPIPASCLLDIMHRTFWDSCLRVNMAQQLANCTYSMALIDCQWFHWYDDSCRTCPGTEFSSKQKPSQPLVAKHTQFCLLVARYRFRFVGQKPASHPFRDWLRVADFDVGCNCWRISLPPGSL